MHSVFAKTFRDKRWFILGWFIGFSSLAALMVAFYPSMHQEGTIDQLMATMPEAFKGLVGNLADLQYFDTYLASQLFDIRLSLLGGIMVTILALGITVGEEEKGQLRTLLGLPISRTALLLQKWLAMLVIIFIVLTSIVILVYGLQGTVDARMPVDAMLKLIFMMWLVLSTIATVTFSVAMVTGRRSIAMLVGTIVMAGSFVVSTFAAAVDWLKEYEWLSLFHYFPASEVVREGIEVSNVFVLVGVALISLLLAVIVFRHRDVN